MNPRYTSLVAIVAFALYIVAPVFNLSGTVVAIEESEVSIEASTSEELEKSENTKENDEELKIQDEVEDTNTEADSEDNSESEVDSTISESDEEESEKSEETEDVSVSTGNQTKTEEDNVLDEDNLSATPTPTQESTLELEPSPTNIPEVSPTIVLSELAEDTNVKTTPTSTPSPTITPIATVVVSPTPEQVSQNIVIEYEDTPPPVISGYKWIDKNGNGEWDKKEKPKKNVKICLEIIEPGHKKFGKVRCTKTNKYGAYMFKNVKAGVDYVVFEKINEEKWEQTYPGTNRCEIIDPENGGHYCCDFGNKRIKKDGEPTPTPNTSPTNEVTPTPSPTIDITPTLTPTIIPTVIVTPTPTPTVVVTPTITPDVTTRPTQEPTLTPTVTPTPTPTPTSVPTQDITPFPTEVNDPTPTPTQEVVPFSGSRGTQQRNSEGGSVLGETTEEPVVTTTEEPPVEEEGSVLGEYTDQGNTLARTGVDLRVAALIGFVNMVIILSLSFGRGLNRK